MITKKVEGTIEQAYGRALDKTLTYSIDVNQFETPEEVRSAGEWPNDKQIVAMVNQRVIAAKRQEAIKSTLDAAGVKAPTLEDPQEALKATAKILLAQKMAETQEQAETMARAILGRQ